MTHKLSLSLLLSCLALTAAAEPVGRQAALYTAKSFLTAKGKGIAPTSENTGSPSRAKAKASTSTGKNWDDAFYVFNAGDDGGYVIVSADDRTEPILGYVDKGSFDPDNIPENMRSWLQLYADQIDYIVKNDIQPNDPILRKRNKVQATKHSIGELLTTRWNQGHPYNLTCPLYYKEDGTQAYPASGCVATAMAQVVKFHEYPEKTKATIPAHSCNYTLSDGTKKTVNMKAIPRNTKLEWELMQDTYNCYDGHEHDRADTAVANLVFYCGQGVKMGYGGSSGASTAAARNFFVTYFGYDDCALWAWRGDYSIDQWFNLLYDELEQGYPILFSGHSSGGGHAFVVDGFDGDNLFHVNWGWGGGSNGYFLISILNPGDNSGIGASSSSDGYSMSNGALLNLRAPSDAKQESFARLSIDNVSVTNTSIRATFVNRTGASGSFNTNIVMLDDDGSFTPVTTTQTISGMVNGATQLKTFQLLRKLPEGHYKLSPASKLTTSKVWRPKYNLIDEYIDAVVDSAGIPKLTLRTPTREIVIDTITFPGNRVVGQQQEVKVTFRAPYDEYFELLHLMINDGDSTYFSKSQSMIAARGGETVDVSFFFTPKKTGTHTLMFCKNSNGDGKVAEGTMEVVSESEAVMAKLAVTSYTITNSSSNTIYGKRIVGKAAIKNQTAVDFHGKVRVQIWSQKFGESVAWSGGSRTVEVDIAAGKIATIDYEFEGLSEGYTYRLPIYYVNQSGNLSGGGLWDHGWSVNSGVLTWKNNGIIAGQAYRAALTAGTNICGLLADCKDFSRLMPNKNPNTIYAFAQGMELPKNADTVNYVLGNHAAHINLVREKPFYAPVNFEADTASFVFDFPDTESCNRWHAITMPFEADSIFVDGNYVSLDDTLKHFWIYEFAAQGNDNDVIFAPAKVLRANTPYIIAADTTMLGHAVEFRSFVVPFPKTGTDKMIVSSPQFKFHGTTIAPTMKNCYIMNDEGTAFEYKTTMTTVTGLTSYFTTNLPEETMPESLVLPEIPQVPVRDITLDESVAAPVLAGHFNSISLKRTFDAGWNTVCLPFDVANVEEVFGEGAVVYEYSGFFEGELDFVATESIAAGKPYIIFVPNAISEDIVFADIDIAEESIVAGSVKRSGTEFCGTYLPIAASEWPTFCDTDGIYILSADGTVASLGQETGLNGFRAYFNASPEKEVTGINFYDDPTGIASIEADGNVKASADRLYDLSGRKMQSGRVPRGIYITGGKKIAVK